MVLSCCRVLQDFPDRVPNKFQQEVAHSKPMEKARSLKYYQYSIEGQKFHQNLAPVLVTILWNSLAFSKKLLPVLIFTGTAPRRASTSSGKKSVSPKLCSATSDHLPVCGSLGLRQKDEDLGPSRSALVDAMPLRPLVEAPQCFGK